MFGLITFERQTSDEKSSDDFLAHFGLFLEILKQSIIDGRSFNTVSFSQYLEQRVRTQQSTGYILSKTVHKNLNLLGCSFMVHVTPANFKTRSLKKTMILKNVLKSRLSYQTESRY